MQLADDQWRATQDCHEIHVNPSHIGATPLGIEGIENCVWPPNLTLQEITDPKIVGTYFNDHASYHAQLVQSLIDDASGQQPNGHGLGGKKVRSQDVWMENPFRLLTLRALLMFAKLYNQPSAHVADRWGNVIEQGDYSAVHAHFESVASVVYFVDMGDDDEKLFSGKFELIDPRIEFCCPRGPQRPTRGLMPKLFSGVMLLFPSEYLHHVHPYYGTRPRLTLAWNIAAGSRPEGQSVAALEAQSPGIYGAVTSNDVSSTP